MMIDKKTLKKIKKILESDEDVLLAYLFGSRIAKTAITQSDLDLACYLKPADETFYLEKEKDLLRKLLFPGLKFSLDFHLLNVSPLLMKYEVISTGELIFCRDELAKFDFETTVCHQYFDSKPFIDLYNDLIKEAVQG
jgi:predicted nucleotidyltransferase